MTIIDLAHAPLCACNHGLDTLHKAIAEQPDEGLLWRPHESPWIRDLVEHFTDAGQAAFQAAKDALLAALGIGQSVPLLRKADGWTPDEIDALRARLAKPLDDYTAEDWLALVDLVIATRLTAPLNGAAADLAWRSTLAGQLQAIASGTDQTTQALPALAALVTHATPPPGLLESATADFAKARLALHVQGITSDAKTRIGQTLLRHFEENGLARPGLLQQTLLDDFGTLNRDWRRIAITEAGETANLAYLAQQTPGARVQRVEAYEGACPFCRKLNGQIFTWSDTPLDDTHGWTHVWPGKTNVGRSASPRKRTEDGLVERTESELWWPTAGVVHPNCRGRWVSLPDESISKNVDPLFDDWLEKELKLIGI